MSHLVRRSRYPGKQSGLALLLVIGVLGLGATLMLVRAFNEAALGNPRELGNARVLEDAKAALLMYVSRQVATEAYPGKIPCPEDTSLIGTVNEGRTSTYCSLPAVGRLPWKTLGLAAAPLDLDGEQLWYAVSPGFNRSGSGVTLVINSNTPAGLTVDESPARAVAIIFSPGRVLPGQIRSTISAASPPAAANYLDGENATLDVKFSTYGPAKSVSTTFNDQAMTVTHRDLFTVVEQAVTRRLNDTMVSGTKPLTDIYASAGWGASSAAPVFPFAAPFSNPDTSPFQGASTITNGTSQGLLPVTYSTTPTNATVYCNPATDGARCNPTFVSWSSYQSITQTGGAMALYVWPVPACTVSAAQLTCTIYTSNIGSMTVRVVATASNVAMALRQLDPDAPSTADFNAAGRTATAVLNADGSSRITFTGTMPTTGGSPLAGFTCLILSPLSFVACFQRTFTIPIRIFADHPIVNSSDSEYGWFTRNEWHKLTYYAIASGFAASGARSCTAAAADCLTITNLGTTPIDDKRAILLLAGRAIRAQSRPSGTLSNYLESENLSPVDRTFVTLKPSLEANDRVVIVGTN